MLAIVKYCKLPLWAVMSIGSLFAATVYQGHPDRKHKLWNIISTESYIHHTYACAGMLLHINGKFTMEKMS